jgi:hypothetical protein
VRDRAALMLERVAVEEEAAARIDDGCSAYRRKVGSRFRAR